MDKKLKGSPEKEYRRGFFAEFEGQGLGTPIVFIFCIEYIRTSIRTFEVEIAKKIRTSRLSEKMGVLIKKKVYPSGTCSLSRRLIKVYYKKYRITGEKLC